MPSATDQIKPRRIDTLDDVAAGADALARREPRFARLVESNGLPELRRRGAGLESLLFLVTEQQISLTAAAAIWQRFEAAFAPFEAARLAATPVERIRACGQSLPKARAIRAIATAVTSGSLDIAGLDGLDDAAARSALMAIHGIGPWTAETYLLSSLGRPDAWPAGDIALQHAAGWTFGFDTRPDRAALDRLAEPWRPWRAVAARLLWAEYRRRRLEK